MDWFDLLPFAIVGLMILIGIVAVVGTRIYERKRTEKFEEAAGQLGLPFYKEGDPLLIEQLSALQLFSQGRSKRLFNMIHGETEEVDMAVFDYKYTVGSGKNSHTHNQTVVCFHSPDLNLPQFSLFPQHFFHSIGKMFGYQDIDFETHPTFSKQYVLRGEDEVRIRDVFREEVLVFFEGHQAVNAEAHGDRLVFYRSGKRIKPDEIRSLMADGFKLFALLRS